MSAKVGTVNRKTTAVLYRESKKTNKIKDTSAKFVEQKRANSDLKQHRTKISH